MLIATNCSSHTQMTTLVQ